MPFSPEETIAAIATAAGHAERGIIRVSGEVILPLVEAMFVPARADETVARQVVPTRTTGQFRCQAFSVGVPGALCLWPRRRSYTGQPMAEFHVPGSPPVLDALLQEALRRGARPAERGEFTLRAFLSGRIDLVQAEAVLGVIDAPDHIELQKALRQLGGAVTSRLNAVRQDLIALLGDLEAGLDFADEGISFIHPVELCVRIERNVAILDALSSESENRLPSGYRPRVVLAGLPNAGKSTLFNAIARQEKALVSSVSGTTRDYLSVSVELDGMLFELIDTAGWEDVKDRLSNTAQQKRADQLDRADLVLWCRAADLSGTAADEDTQRREALQGSGIPVLSVLTCFDRAPDRAIPDAAIAVSAKSGLGIDDLVNSVQNTLTALRSSRGELLGATAARCQDCLRRAAAVLRSAAEGAGQGLGEELTAMELRQALHEIAVVLGAVYTDDILDHIFSSFCIGK